MSSIFWSSSEVGYLPILSTAHTVYENTFSRSSTALGQAHCSACLSWGELPAPNSSQPISACSLQSLPLNKDQYTQIVSYSSSTKREARALTGYSASIHVVEDVPQTEDPGGGSRWAASEQRGAEFLPRFARVQVRVGFQSGAHAARQRAHLIRSAAAFHLASIALHAHFLARKLQRRVEKREWRGE